MTADNLIIFTREVREGVPSVGIILLEPNPHLLENIEVSNKDMENL